MFAHDGSPTAFCRRISLAVIDKVVVARLGQTRVLGNAQPAVFNRLVAMYLAKHVGGWSTTRIGRFYNGRDHSTVCHALKKIETLRKSQGELDELLASLKDEVRSEVQRNGLAAHDAIICPAPRTGEVLVP